MTNKPSSGVLRSGLLVVLGFLPGFASATHCTWNPTVDYNWNDSRNWIGPVPGPGDDVTIGHDAGTGNQSFKTLTITGGTVTMGNLGVTVLNLNGGALNVQACTLDTLNQSAGGLNCTTMDLAASGTWTWTGGYINATTITVPPSAALDISGGQVVLGANAILNNSGTTTISGGPLQGYNSSVFNNLPGGRCVLSAATPFTNYFTGNVFNNDGVLESTGSPVTLANWTFNLNNETRCTSGSLAMKSVTNIPEGATFTGAGAISFQGDVRLNGSATVTAGSLVLGDGSLTGTAPAGIIGTLDWTAGSIHGTLTVPSGSSLLVSGDGAKSFATDAILDNHGTTRWTGGASIQCVLRVALQNHTGGRFEIGADGRPFSHYHDIGNVFHNDGLFTKNGGTGGTASLQSLTFNLNGELNCDNGTVEIVWPANLAGGSTITGTGTVALNGSHSIPGLCTETIANLRLTGGTLTGTAPGGFVGTLNWDGGTLYGAVDIPAGSVVEVSGPDEHYLATDAVLNVNGTLRWLGEDPLRGYHRSVINILPTGRFDVAADGALLGNYHATNTINIEGQLVKSAGTGTSDVGLWTAHATGDIICETGTLGFQGTTHLENGCEFSGAGTTTIGGTVSLDGTTTCTPQVHIASGTFTGNGGELNGEIRWVGGELYGTTVVGAGGHMTIGGPDGKFLATDAVLQIAGTADFEEGFIRGYNRSRIEVVSGGSFDATAVASLTPYFSTNTLQVQAGGFFNVKTGADLVISGWAVDNDGTFTVENSAQASCRMGGTSSGTFVSESGGVLIFADGTQTMNAGATSTGPGEVRVAGGVLIANDSSIDSLVHLKGGSVGSSGENGIFRLKDGSTWDHGYLFGKVSVPGGNTFRVEGDGSLRRLNEDAELSVHGTLRWDGPGVIQGYKNSSVINEAGGRIEFHADGTTFNNYFTGNVLINRGTIEKVGGGGETTLSSWTYQNEGILAAGAGVVAITSNLELNDGSEIAGSGRIQLRSGRTTLDGTTTVSGGVLELGGAEVFGHANGTGTLAGSGIEWTAGQTTNVVTMAGAVTTPGAGTKLIGGYSELRVSGSLTVNGSGPLQCYDESIVKTLPAGTLHVTGSGPLTNYFWGNTLVNEGTLRIGNSTASISLPWNFTQTATGRLEVEVGGEDPGLPEFDRLIVTGTATLAGTVAPTLLGGYDPGAGTEFYFLTATGGLGGTSFDSVTGIRFAESNDGNASLLTAQAIPYDYDTWAAENSLTGPDAEPGANPDHDQFTNFEEYAFKLDPNTPDVLEMNVSVTEIDSQQWLVLPYRTWQNRIDAGLAYRAGTSVDLQSFENSGIIDELDPVAPPVAGSEARRARVPITSGAKFLLIEAYFSTST